VTFNITLKGKMMYERDAIVQFIKMLEAGLFPKGTDFANTRKYSLRDWKKAFDDAAVHNGIGQCVVLTPGL
jgi:hypothetical protein